MQYEHGCAIDQKFGSGVARKLLELSVETRRYSMEDLRVLARTYQDRTRELIAGKQME